ncbi:MAG: hypothetical protein ACKVJK_15840 [Methylophagaceae bacterium]
MSKYDLNLLHDRIDQLSKQLDQQTRIVAKVLQQFPSNQPHKYNEWVSRSELSEMIGLSEKIAHKLCIVFEVEMKEVKGVKNNRYRFKRDDIYPKLLTTPDKWEQIDFNQITLT